MTVKIVSFLTKTEKSSKNTSENEWIDPKFSWFSLSAKLNVLKSTVRTDCQTESHDRQLFALGITTYKLAFGQFKSC